MPKNEDAIRPIYTSLKGFSLQLESLDKGNSSLYDSAVWELYNSFVDDIKQLTGDSFYERFSITPKRHDSMVWVPWSELRTKTSTLIGRLNAEYFSDDHPFDSANASLIQMTQTNHQSVTFVLDLQEKIIQGLSQTSDPNEIRFLDRLKASLGGARSILELLGTILALAQQFGITPERAKQLLGL